MGWRHSQTQSTLSAQVRPWLEYLVCAGETLARVQGSLLPWLEFLACNSSGKALARVQGPHYSAIPIYPHTTSHSHTATHAHTHTHTHTHTYDQATTQARSWSLRTETTKSWWTMRTRPSSSLLCGPRNALRLSCESAAPVQGLLVR